MVIYTELQVMVITVMGTEIVSGLSKRSGISWWQVQKTFGPVFVIS
jgi:hypothetical protein